jgi:phage terminase large subunit-like protein
MTPPATKKRTPASPSSTQPDVGCQNCDWVPRAGELWPTHGPLAVRWIEDNCICGEGDWFGKKITLRPDQKRFLYRWYEYCPRCDQWHYDEALRGAATGDGKTQFIASIVVLEFAGPPQIAISSPNIPIAAASFEQADLLFSAVSTMCGGRDQSVEESPLRGFFEVYDTEIKFSDGRPGRIFRVAAVAGTNEGGLPSLFVCDELHEWGAAPKGGDKGDRKARVKTVIGKSTRKRRTPRGCGRQISLSTAGFDIDRSLLGDMVKLGRKVIRDPRLSPRYLVDWREAPDGLDYRKPEDRARAVRAASCAADVLWSVTDRVNAWGKPDMPAHEWIRYYANKWVDVTEDSWLKESPAAWSECQGSWASSDANPWCFAVDMALKHDSCSVARVEQLPDGRLAVTARIWRATEHNGRIPHDDVWNYIKDNAKGLGFRGVVYDPRYFEVPARMLEDHGILAIEFDQSPQRMAPACGLTFKLILEHGIVQDGDPDLAAHVKGAVSIPQERGGFTLKKGRSKGHIDACISMCMGVWVLHEVPEPEPQQFFSSWR